MFVIFALLLILSFCACQSKYVYYNDIQLESSKLSKDTIKWLESYNELSEEYKATMDYLPPDLEVLLTEMGVLSEEEVIYEKPITIVTKVLDVRKNEKGDGDLFLISTDKLYWCSVKDASKLKVGYVVEVIYSNVSLEKGKNIINPNSVTLISGTYNYIGFVMDVVDALWKDTAEVNNNVSCVILDLATIPSLSDTDKVGLVYLLNEKYNIEFKVGGPVDKTDKDLLINFYIWDNSETEDVLFFFDVKKAKNDTNYIKYTKCAALADGNQLIFVKDYENRTDISPLMETETDVEEEIVNETEEGQETDTTLMNNQNDTTENSENTENINNVESSQGNLEE